jgi:hypothetical protein
MKSGKRLEHKRAKGFGARSEKQRGDGQLLRDHAEAPDIRPSRHCFQPHDCEFWNRCTSRKPKDWVFHIPRISTADFDELESFDVISMRNVPKNFPLKPKQRRVVDAAKSGKVYRSPELARFLPLLAPPASYLDFETFSPAIPIYVNTRPYQRIPFQWSWHYNSGNGPLIHADFLAKGEIDPRREFSETLLITSEHFPGAVMAWSRFEEKVIRDMADLFPDLAGRLIALLYRIVDLLPIVCAPNLSARRRRAAPRCTTPRSTNCGGLSRSRKH